MPLSRRLSWASIAPLLDSGERISGTIHLVISEKTLVLTKDPQIDVEIL